MSYVKLWCLGFMFSSDLRQVILIKKTRTLHVGKLNGVGGTIEQEHESSRAAMVRECLEETGYASREADWVDVGDLYGQAPLGQDHSRWRVVVYALRMPPEADSFLDHAPNNDAVPTKHYLITIADLDLAPHTGALIFAALEKLKNPNACHIYLQEL